MATKQYEGGTGRPVLRNVPSPPYDSSPSATEAGGRGRGWLSKLVDPSARLIITSASRFFSSIFAKNIGTTEEVPHPKSSPQVQDRANNFVDIKLSFNYDGDILSEQEFSSRLDDILQLKHLLYHKSFTKAEISRLKTLLLSRVMKNEDSNINLEENLDRSMPPKESHPTPDLNSVPCLPVSSADSLNNYTIRKPRGRSSLYAFSRSPYCRFFMKINHREYNPYKNNNDDQTRSLKWALPSLSNVKHYGHGQALKRGRSDRDCACFGDGQRRVRQRFCLQKFNLSTQHIVSTCKKYRSGIDLRAIDDQVGGMLSPSILFAPPPRPLEMARKILHQLDEQ